MKHNILGQILHPMPSHALTSQYSELLKDTATSADSEKHTRKPSTVLKRTAYVRRTLHMSTWKTSLASGPGLLLRRDPIVVPGKLVQ
eukprot:5991258-Amphidinium_carterae.2